MAMKSTVFWDVTSCSLVDVQHGILLLLGDLLGLLFDSEDRGTTFLRNMDELPDWTEGNRIHCLGDQFTASLGTSLSGSEGGPPRMLNIDAGWKWPASRPDQCIFRRKREPPSSH